MSGLQSENLTSLQDKEDLDLNHKYLTIKVMLNMVFLKKTNFMNIGSVILGNKSKTGSSAYLSDLSWLQTISKILPPSD